MRCVGVERAIQEGTVRRDLCDKRLGLGSCSCTRRAALRVQVEQPQITVFVEGAGHRVADGAVGAVGAVGAGASR